MDQLLDVIDRIMMPSARSTASAFCTEPIGIMQAEVDAEQRHHIEFQPANHAERLDDNASKVTVIVRMERIMNSGRILARHLDSEF
ncbi:hypothetical protein ACQP2P_42015 [Dactylosporangium sp. CA-139114]|uniref:hypothetical protein n=1 Tax=Dactylosporangium sp. CA-139114 TaxID=3239931 RepID=UPI003D963EF3